MKRLKFAIDMGKAFYHENKGQSVAHAIITAVLSFIVVFYILAYTYQPIEDASVTLKNKLGNATISGVSGLNSLPGVAVLLFILMAILGLILMAVGSRRI